MEKAFIYRRGLGKEDFMRDTLSVKVSSKLCEGGSGSAISMAGLVSAYMKGREVEWDVEKEDKLSTLRENLKEKSLSKIMDPLHKNVSFFWHLISLG